MSDSPYYSPASTQTPGTEGAIELGGNGAAVHQQALTERMAQGAHHAIDRLAEAAAPRLQRLDEAVSGAGVQLKHQARHALEVGEEWTESLRATVRRNPLAAVATALIAGVLIARITR